MVNSNELVSTVDSMTSHSIKESDGDWWTAKNLGTLMQAMTGSTHSGDENGKSTYTGSLFYAK